MVTMNNNKNLQVEAEQKNQQQKFRIELRQTFEDVTIVKADNESEAVEKVLNDWGSNLNARVEILSIERT
jgi:ribosomal protein L20A (L18A)